MSMPYHPLKTPLHETDLHPWDYKKANYIFRVCSCQGMSMPYHPLKALLYETDLHPWDYKNLTTFFLYALVRA